MWKTLKHKLKYLTYTREEKNISIMHVNIVLNTWYLFWESMKIIQAPPTYDISFHNKILLEIFQSLFCFRYFICIAYFCNRHLTENGNPVIGSFRNIFMNNSFASLVYLLKRCVLKKQYQKNFMAESIVFIHEKVKDGQHLFKKRR